ncbi:MAG TPA: LLM class F420-dependent oxidoreductase [Streptosporangiaceae bacterium]|nr:LLM class F420-dependent oxidoreductase [Streptosporangiaceae bacterium]
MKLGISLGGFPDSTLAGRMAALLRLLAQRADEAGFDSLWTMDHFFQIPITGQPPEAPLLEAYAVLAFLAAQTHRIRLGTMVTCVAYRHPGVLIKAVTSIDVLSGGRVNFGVGAGAPFNEVPPGRSPRDFEAYGLGIPFPPLGERFERLEELLQIALQMWRGDEAPYEGTHYQMLRPLNSPNTVQSPHPPILIAGSGERKTLRLVARYGDMCNLFDLPGTGFADDLKHKLDVLRSHCEEAGRDYDDIEKTVSTFAEPGSDPARTLDHLAELADLGIGHVMMSPRQPWDEAGLDWAGELVPDVHAIPVAR